MSTATIESPAMTGSVICRRPELLHSIQLALQLTSKRHPLADLVQLSAKDSALTVYATDLQTWAITSVRTVQVESEFTIGVSCRKLAEVLREMPEEAVKISLSGTKLRVAGDAAQFNLPTEDAKRMPPFPGDASPRSTVAIPTETFSRLFRQSRHAVSKTETRFSTMKGVMVVAKNGRLEFAGTEGHVLSIASCECDKAATISMSVPVGALALACDAAGDGDIAIGLNESGNIATVDVGDTKIATTLFEGDLVPYRDCIPNESETGELTDDREGLSAAVRQASLVADENDPYLVLDLEPGRGLRISSTSEQGDSSVSVPCKYKGKSMRIGLRPGWILQGIDVGESGEVSVHFFGPKRPPVFKCGPDYMFVVFPRAI